MSNLVGREATKIHFYHFVMVKIDPKEIINAIFNPSTVTTHMSRVNTLL